MAVVVSDECRMIEQQASAERKELAEQRAKLLGSISAEEHN